MAVSDGLVSAGVSAATGNYVSAGLSLVGVGLSLFGGNEQANIAKQEAQVSQDEIAQEQKVNDQRQQAMELSAHRQQLEIVRNTQRQRALGLASATSKGAQYGSGMPGGQADTTNQGVFAFQGVSQNLQIGENIFGLDKLISGDKSQMSALQGQMAEAGNYAAYGAAVSKSADPLGRLSGQLFASGPQSTTSNGVNNYNSGNPIY